jgi:hypothetical protein
VAIIEILTIFALVKLSFKEEDEKRRANSSLDDGYDSFDCSQIPPTPTPVSAGSQLPS